MEVNWNNSGEVKEIEGPCALSKLSLDTDEEEYLFESQHPYQNGDQCSLTYSCPPGKFVVVNVLEFDLEYGDSAEYLKLCFFIKI